MRTIFDSTGHVETGCRYNLSLTTSGQDGITALRRQHCLGQRFELFLFVLDFLVRRHFMVDMTHVPNVVANVKFLCNFINYFEVLALFVCLRVVGDVDGS